MLSQIVDGEGEAAAAAKVLHDQPTCRAWAQHPVPVAVTNVPVLAGAEDEAAVVAAGPEQVPGLPVPVAGGGDRPGDVPVGDGGGAGSGVEGVDVEAGAGQHQRVLPGLSCLGPVGEDGVEGAVAVRAWVEPTFCLVGAQDGGIAGP